MKRLMYVVWMILLFSTSVIAQEQPVYLTVALPPNLAVTDDVFAGFQTEHPGVEVIQVNAMLPTSMENLEDYFTELEAYARSADILYFPSYTLTPEATEAGFLLDLTPLTTLGGDEPNFHQVAWKSFQWDGGFWALPIDFSLGVLSYDPAAFDAAGLTYPDESWTLSEIASAARSVGRLNLSNGSTSFLRSLLDENLFDENSIPNLPYLTNPSSIALLETWKALVEEQLTTTVPMGEGQTASWSITPLTDAQPVVLLPGGYAGMLRIDGVAISRGTNYPELAYALAQYLTTLPELYAVYGESVIPARHNGTYVPDDSLISQAIDNALSYADLRYFNYFLRASAASSNAATALAAAETDARIAQETALTYRDSLVLSVNPPTLPSPVSEGEIALRFGMFSPISPVPNQSQWDRTALEFAEADPQVGAIEFSTFTNFTGDTIQQSNYDCFVAPFAPSVLDPSVLLDLTPLMNADPTFIQDDFLPGTLTAVSVNQHWLGYPLTFRPALLVFRNNSGIISPDGDWTFNEFVNILNTSPEQPALGTNNVVATHLLLLIAANGGLPIDYRTEPPTLDFTGNVDAIRGVLDLARNGYIFYRPQWVQGVAPLGPSFAPIMTGGGEIFFADPDVTYVLYPQGSDYQPIAFGIGAGYIARTAQNPEACYRWISTISESPDLFVAAMPTRNSALTAPLLLAAQGENLVSRYNEIASRLELPGTILFPSPLYGSGSVQNFYLEEILYRAFDQYVQGNADLNAILSEAEANARLYLSCTAAIPPFTEGQDYDEYTSQYERCSLTVSA